MVRNQLPSASGQPLLFWDEVPRTSRTFGPEVAMFSQFQVYRDTIQAKEILNLSHLNHFYPAIYRRIQKEDELIVYDLITRYGP